MKRKNGRFEKRKAEDAAIGETLRLRNTEKHAVRLKQYVELLTPWQELQRTGHLIKLGILGLELQLGELEVLGGCTYTNNCKFQF